MATSLHSEKEAPSKDSPHPYQLSNSSGLVLKMENSLSVPWYTRRGLFVLSRTTEPLNHLLKSFVFTCEYLTNIGFVCQT
jgi:hypothetical protein